VERFRCPACATYKPASEFPRNRAERRGYATYCKPCHNRITKRNIQRLHGSGRNFQLKRRYGVDAVQVEWMILQQGGVCALCGDGAPAHVDHSHENGEVRGIVCFNCNRALGYLDDQPDLFYRIAEYLEAHTEA
jgi:hypothetical protein